MDSIDWTTLTTQDDGFHFFVPQTADGSQYNRWEKLDEMFEKNVTGIVTARDSLVI